MAPPSIDIQATPYEDPAPAHEPFGQTIVHVESDSISYNGDHILSQYVYENARVTKVDGKLVVKPTKTEYEFKTNTVVPKVGYCLFLRGLTQSYARWLGR